MIRWKEVESIGGNEGCGLTMPSNAMISVAANELVADVALLPRQNASFVVYDGHSFIKISGVFLKTSVALVQTEVPEGTPPSPGYHKNVQEWHAG